MEDINEFIAEPPLQNFGVEKTSQIQPGLKVTLNESAQGWF